MIFPVPTSPMKATPAASKPMPGRGTLLASTPFGFAYSASTGPRGFGHPWKPLVSGRQARLSRGTVENFTPTIAGVPMTETALVLDSTIQNEQGESWIVLEAEINADGRITKDTRLELVQSVQTGSVQRDLARTPITLLLWRGRRLMSALPVVFFNLRYHRVLPANGPARHYFL